MNNRKSRSRGWFIRREGRIEEKLSREGKNWAGPNLTGEVGQEVGHHGLQLGIGVFGDLTLLLDGLE